LKDAAESVWDKLYEQANEHKKETSEKNKAIAEANRGR